MFESVASLFCIFCLNCDCSDPSQPHLLISSNISRSFVLNQLKCLVNMSKVESQYSSVNAVVEFRRMFKLHDMILFADSIYVFLFVIHYSKDNISYLNSLLFRTVFWKDRLPQTLITSEEV